MIRRASCTHSICPVSTSEPHGVARGLADLRPASRHLRSLGGAFLLTKVAVETIPPSLLSGGRGLLAAATLGVVLALSRDGLRGKAADGWVPAVVLGTLSGWLPNVLTAWALTRIDSSLAAILGAASPIIVGVLAHYVLVHEPMGRSQFGGCSSGSSAWR